MSSSLLAARRQVSGPHTFRRRLIRLRTAVGVATVTLASLSFAGAAQAATPPVNLGSDSSFSVLAGSTVTNTGPTTMAADLGLDPGSSVTGAPVTLASTHIDDGVAIQAKTDLVTAFNDAAGRSATPLASADLSSQVFTPGVYKASSSLLFSAGSVTLNAQGNPDAVFIFQVGSSMTTGAATSVVLSNGAQACNVFWQVGASLTLGTNSVFAGTVMAQTTITAGTHATLDGRLLAENGAVNLDSNTITTSACSTSAAGGTTTSTTTTSTSTPTSGTTGSGSTTTGKPKTPTSNKSTSADAKKLAAKRLAAKKKLAAKKLAAKKLAAKKLAAQKLAAQKLAAKKLAAKKLAAKKLATKRLAAQRRAHRARVAKLRRLKQERNHEYSPAHQLKSPGGFTG